MRANSDNELYVEKWDHKDWEKDRIRPIYKSGDEEVQNHRVSHLSVCYKILIKVPNIGLRE